VYGDCAPEAKHPRRHPDQSPQSNGKIKNVWRYTSTPLCIFITYSLISHNSNGAPHFIVRCITSMYTGITTTRGDSCVMDIAVVEIISYALLIKKVSYQHGSSSQRLWSCGRSHKRTCEPPDLQQGLFLPLNNGGINKFQAYFLHFHAFLTIRQWKPGCWSL